MLQLRMLLGRQEPLLRGVRKRPLENRQAEEGSGVGEASVSSDAQAC